MTVGPNEPADEGVPERTPVVGLSVIPAGGVPLGYGVGGCGKTAIGNKGIGISKPTCALHLAEWTR